LDTGLFHLINNLAAHDLLLDTALVVGAQYGPVALVLGLLVQWFLPGAGVRDRRRRVVLAIVAAIVALAVAYVVGAVYFRPRPFVTVPNAHLLLGQSPDPSFPSDHATLSGALAYMLAIESPIWATVSWLFVVIVAFARVFAGTHYPTDVVGGALLGAITGWAIFRFRGSLMRVVDRLIDLVEQLPLLRRLGTSSRSTAS